MKRVLWALTCVVLVAGLAACSDDDDSGDGSDSTDTTAAIDSTATTGDAADVIDSIAGDIDIRASGLEAALGADVEVIDETTVQLTFDDGSVDTDSIQACAVATGVLDAGDTAIVVYPDGQKTCD